MSKKDDIPHNFHCPVHDSARHRLCLYNQVGPPNTQQCVANLFFAPHPITAK